MTITVTMIAPSFAAGFNVTARSGTIYTSNVNGLISAAVADVNSLQQAGCIVTPEQPVVTLALSTAAGVYVVPGAINLIPVSTIAAVCLLPAASYLGQTTTLVSASTGNFTITSSGVSLLDNLAASATILTCNKGTCDLIAVGSTLYQLSNRSILSNSSAAVVYGIASS